jgi:hypothetical protein
LGERPNFHRLFAAAVTQAVPQKKAIERDIKHTVKIFSKIAQKEHKFAAKLLLFPLTLTRLGRANMYRYENILAFAEVIGRL